MADFTANATVISAMPLVSRSHRVVDNILSLSHSLAYCEHPPVASPDLSWPLHRLSRSPL